MKYKRKKILKMAQCGQSGQSCKNMLFLRLFLANFNNFPIFWALNAVKKNEIKKDMMK